MWSVWKSAAALGDLLIRNLGHANAGQKKKIRFKRSCKYVLSDKNEQNEMQRS